MIYLGRIKDKRHDPIRPIMVTLEIEGQILELGWCPVSHSAWATVIFDKIQLEEWVQVWDNEFEGHPDQYMVTAFYPSSKNPLEENQRRIARHDDEVVIDGTAYITLEQSQAIANRVAPPKMDLKDDLKGKITAKQKLEGADPSLETAEGGKA
jgi:hypothetical protein